VQIQHQFMVSGAAMAHLWIYDCQQGILLEVPRHCTDAAWLQAA